MAEQPPEGDELSENLPAAAEPSTADYEKFAQPEKPIRNWNKIVSIIIIILVLAGAGAGGAWYLKNHKTTKPAVVTQAAQTAPAKVAAITKSYTSPNLYLTFSYPADWTIVDTGGGAMTASSPTMQLKGVNGQSSAGKIIMTIRTSSSTLAGFNAGNTTAVLASQKITYSKPTQTQRADTYVTFISYASTAGSNGLDAIYVSGNNGYTLGQAVPQADLIQVSPIVSLTFAASSGKALTIAASNWQDSAFSGPLLAMLKSLSIT